MPGFDPNCRKCPRISRYLAGVRQQYPGYHGRPVAAFGDTAPGLLIVGLAPGLHGANATGRPFTGDYAGVLLYDTLYRFGYSNMPTASSLHDGLVLSGCRITNAVKCVPPQNKPVAGEINCCNEYLSTELGEIPGRLIILALGQIAHKAVLTALDRKQSEFRFGHNLAHRLAPGRWLVDSYHCSRYNTQTRRLTTEMFHAVFKQISTLRSEAS